MANLLETSYTDKIVIARGNVKHLSGGPAMTLVGFIHPMALKLYTSIEDVLSEKQHDLLAEKIYVDQENRIGFYPGVSSKVFFGSMWMDLATNTPTGWHKENTFSYRFHCLTRHYDDVSKKFIYRVFSPLELELAK